MNAKAGVWAGLWVMMSVLSVGSAEQGTPVEKAASPANESTDTAKPSSAESARKECARQCGTADGRCNSEVRRARQECSRNAANNGRNPMTMRDNDFSYFCNYFRNPGRRGSGNFQWRYHENSGTSSRS